MDSKMLECRSKATKSGNFVLFVCPFWWELWLFKLCYYHGWNWLYFYDPETKQPSMEWRHSGSPRPKKFRVQKSAGKVLASVFWDSRGVIMVHYLEKGKSITEEYFSSLLIVAKKLWKRRAKNFPGSGVLFLQDTNRPLQWIQFMIEISKHLTILLILRT